MVWGAWSAWSPDSWSVGHRGHLQGWDALITCCDSSYISVACGLVRRWQNYNRRLVEILGCSFAITSGRH